MKKVAIIKAFAGDNYKFSNDLHRYSTIKYEDGIFKIFGDKIEIHIINLIDKNLGSVNLHDYEMKWLHEGNESKLEGKAGTFNTDKFKYFKGGSQDFPYKYIGDGPFLSLKLDLIDEFLADAEKQISLDQSNSLTGSQENFLKNLFK